MESGGKADVKDEYSIAALVGTLDSHYFSFTTSTKVQRRRKTEEMITQIDVMIAEVLRQYYKKNAKLPKHIIYYRDGVSEGQFSQVLKYEIEKMKECFEVYLPTKLPSLKGNPYKPKITLIVVQKRHHHRFRPQFEKDGQGKAGNIPAGTVCDTTVTDRNMFDVFLSSHEGIQGTSRPTHYYVLRDDYGFTPDELYKTTFFLAHTYAKCTRSISVRHKMINKFASN